MGSVRETEGLQFELQAHLLTNRECAGKAHVQVEDARSAEFISARVAKRTIVRCRSSGKAIGSGNRVRRAALGDLCERGGVEVGARWGPGGTCRTTGC